MQNKWIGIVFVLLLLAVGFGIAKLLWDDSPTTMGTDDVEQEATEEEVEVISDLDDPIQVADENEAGRADKVRIDPMGKREPPKKLPTLSGKVVQAETGEPLKECSIALLHESEFDSKYDERDYIIERVEDEEGLFNIILAEGGTYELSVSARNFLSRRFELKIPDKGKLEDVVIKLEPALIITGRVVDDATNVPISDADVRCSLARFRRMDDEGKVSRSTSRFVANTKTDKRGKFTLSDLNPGVLVVTASHDGHATSEVDATAGGDPVEIRMKRGYRVYGTALDDRGQPAEGVEIRFKGDGGNKGGPFLCGRDGTYQTDPLSPGNFRVYAEAPSKGDVKLVEFTEEAYRVEIRDRNVELNFGPSQDHVVWKGTFYDWDGSPMRRGQIRVWNDRIDEIPHEQLIKEGASIHQQVKTDHLGRFEIRKLIPGTFKVDMGPGDEMMMLHHGELEEISFDSPGIYELDLRYRRTEISGVVIDGGTNKPVETSYGFVSLSGRNRHYSKYLDKESRFCFRGVPPGTYGMSTQGGEYAAVSYGKIELAADQIIDDIKIVLPASGKLSVKVTGIQDIENTIIDLFVNRTDGTNAWSVGPGRFTKEGSWEIDFPHEVGSWILGLEDPTLGKVERPYEITRGKTTEIVVEASEFRKD